MRKGLRGINNPPAKPGAFVIEPLKGADKTMRRLSRHITACPLDKGGWGFENVELPILPPPAPPPHFDPQEVRRGVPDASGIAGGGYLTELFEATFISKQNVATVISMHFNSALHLQTKVPSLQYLGLMILPL
jgi:hypothetical protein